MLLEKRGPVENRWDLWQLVLFRLLFTGRFSFQWPTNQPPIEAG